MIQSTQELVLQRLYRNVFEKTVRPNSIRGVPHASIEARSAVSKSDLGYQFLAAVNAGRLKLYATPTAELAELREEAAAAKSSFGANQRLAWQVPDTAGHDDLLVSAALTVEAAQHAAPRIARGRSIRREAR